MIERTKQKRFGRKMVQIILRMLLILVLTVMIFFILNSISNNILRVTKYEWKSEYVTQNIRIVLMTDLHNHEYGEKNSRLVEKIQSLSPDLIAMAGDMNLYTTKDNTVVTSLCEDLISVAPIYYSLGNHELAVKETDSLLRELRESGVHVLDNQWEKVKVREDSFFVGGITMFPSLSAESASFLQDFEAQKSLKILLCHYPEFYLWGMDTWDVDLILSGHAHGGQIRIPFKGPFFAPDQGYFPKYAEGIHHSERNTLIVSRGAGNSSTVPRINNPPEIVCIDIQPLEKNDRS